MKFALSDYSYCLPVGQVVWAIIHLLFLGKTSTQEYTELTWSPLREVGIAVEAVGFVVGLFAHHRHSVANLSGHTNNHTSGKTCKSGKVSRRQRRAGHAVFTHRWPLTHHQPVGLLWCDLTRHKGHRKSYWEVSTCKRIKTAQEVENNSSGFPKKTAWNKSWPGESI